MISLLRADLFKMRYRAMPWALLGVAALTIALGMLNSAVQNPAHVTYAFPGGLLQAGAVLPLLGVLAFIFLGAIAVGSEYGYDTWKNLLTRRAGRVPFIVSKWLTLVVALGLGLAILLPWAQAVGLLLDATMRLRGAAPPPVDLVMLLLLTQALAPLVAGSYAILGAVIGRSSVAGIIGGIVWFVGDALIGALFQPASLGMAVSLLQARIYGAGVPSLYVAVASLTVVFSLVAPIAGASIVFRRRDMLGVG